MHKLSEALAPVTARCNSGTMARMSAIQTAKKYVELYNAREFRAMGELFAEDGLWQPPSHTPETRGRTAIIAGFERLAELGSDATFTDARYYEQGDIAIAELVVTTPDGPTSRVADIFQVDEHGRILRMTAYVGPAPL